MNSRLLVRLTRSKSYDISNRNDNLFRQALFGSKMCVTNPNQLRCPRLLHSGHDALVLAGHALIFSRQQFLDQVANISRGTLRRAQRITNLALFSFVSTIFQSSSWSLLKITNFIYGFKVLLDLDSPDMDRRGGYIRLSYSTAATVLLIQLYYATSLGNCSFTHSSFSSVSLCRAPGQQRSLLV